MCAALPAALARAADPDRRCGARRAFCAVAAGALVAESPPVTATGTLVEVTIKLFASFRAGRFEIEKRACPPGTTVDDLVRELGIPHEEVGVILVRGRHAAFEHVAAPGDTIAIFPLLGGG